jgi:hypothetical protein
MFRGNQEKNMKTLLFLLFVITNLFSYNFRALNYQSKPQNEKLTAIPTPTNTDCSEKKFKPKSKAIVASMTIRQLIEELTQSIPSAFRTYEESADYEDLIGKRIRQAGDKALPILTEYFNNSFQTQSAFYCDNWRFATANRIAHDLDRFEFRLRGTTKGKLTIDAFERAIERVERPGFTKKDISYYRTMFLKYLKGINGVDRNIQDTFWVRYGIMISDSELDEFSNFLIERDPTYPSWSDTDFIKDYSRINKAGNPLQVYVLKTPEGFYEAYEKFKKTRQ